MKFNLDDIRKEIDLVDNQLMNLLSERFKLIQKVKDFKIQNNISIENQKREKIIYEKIKSYNSLEYIYIKDI